MIVSACRTAIGTFGGSLKDSHAAHIAAAVIKAANERAGIPDTVPAVTVNRVCIYGMEAVLSDMAMIQAGMADIILSGGVEHLSGVAYEVPKARWGCRLQDQEFVDAMTRALHCGSHLIPHPETGPVDAGRPP